MIFHFIFWHLCGFISCLSFHWKYSVFLDSNVLRSSFDLDLQCLCFAVEIFMVPNFNNSETLGLSYLFPRRFMIDIKLTLILHNDSLSKLKQPSWCQILSLNGKNNPCKDYPSILIGSFFGFNVLISWSWIFAAINIRSSLFF